MFALHETTRKYVCRLAFFALCVAPMLATATWIGAHFVPGRKGRIARELSERLDVHVKLADWREPRPQTVRSAGVTLCDRHSALELANISGLESRLSGGVQLHRADRVSVECTQLAVLAERANAWLSDLPPQSQEIRIAALEFQGPPGKSEAASSSFVLYDVQARIDRDAAGRVQVRLTANSSQGKSEDTSIIHLTLAPSPAQDQAAGIVVLDAAGVELPAYALSGIAPGFGRFGDAARFRGIVRWELGSPVQGALQGKLTGVDLSTILPANSPHTLGGLAEVELQQLSWRGAQLQRLVGAIRAEHAQASQSILEAFAKTLQCPLYQNGLRTGGSGPLIGIDLLAFRFELDARGATLAGACPSLGSIPQGCLATSGGNPLVMHPPWSTFPLGKLVEALAAPGTWTLPATREAVEMADRLPLPTAPQPSRK